MKSQEGWEKGQLQPGRLTVSKEVVLGSEATEEGRVLGLFAAPEGARGPCL